MQETTARCEGRNCSVRSWYCSLIPLFWELQKHCSSWSGTWSCSLVQKQQLWWCPCRYHRDDAGQPQAKQQRLASELGAEPSTSDSEADRDVSLDVDDSGHDEDGALEEDNSDLSEDDSDETPFPVPASRASWSQSSAGDDYFIGQVTKNRVWNKEWGETLWKTPQAMVSTRVFAALSRKISVSVQSDVVFAADISTEPCSSSGWAFCLVSLPDLEKYQFKNSPSLVFVFPQCCSQISISL